MGAHFRVYGIDGTTYLGRLPEFAQATVQEEHNGPGSVQIDYPKAGKSSDLLDLDEAVLVLVRDGIVQPDYYLLEDDNDDTAKDPAKSDVVTFGGRGALGLLEDAIIYPRDYAPDASVINLTPTQEFAAASPGRIMRTLIDKAHVRGALLGVTYDFTDTADSAGVPWPTGYTIVYDAGSDYLKTLQDMGDNGWADFRMSGMTLQMFVPDSSYGMTGVDRPNAIFRLGREVTQGPRVRSRRTKRSTMLLVGDEGALAEQHSVGYVGRRREAYDGRGGVTDLGTLAALGDAELQGMIKSSEAITLVCAVGSPSTPQPGVDYFVGDYVRYDQRRTADNTAYERMRVRTIARVFTPDGVQSISIELNDLVVEASIRLSRKIDAIVNGSTSNSRAPQPPTPGVDETTPAAPLTVDVSSAAYTLHDGTTRAMVVITWPAVLTNTDGSDINDFGAYWVQYAVGLPDEPTVPTNWLGPFEWHDVTYRLDNLTPGVKFVARVAASDFNGNRGDWTTSEVIVLATDDIPPSAPSAPVLTPTLGAVRVDWDGLDLGGAAMTIDTAAVQVLASHADNFAPDDPGVWIADTLQPGAGYTLIPGAVDEDIYVRLVAWDGSGNRSAPSVVAHAVVAPLVAADIIDGAITEAKLATDAVSARAIAAGAVQTTEIYDAAIVTAKIADGTIIAAKIADATITNAKIVDATIQAAKIASVDAGTIQTGLLTADITVSGHIKTATSGARTELNTVGLQAFATDGVTKTLEIKNADGSLVATGIFQNGSPTNYVALNVISATYPGLFFKTPSVPATAGVYCSEIGAGATVQGYIVMQAPDLGSGFSSLNMIGANGANHGSWRLQAINGGSGGEAQILGSTNGSITFTIQPYGGGATTDVVAIGPNVGGLGPGVLITGDLWMSGHAIHNSTIVNPSINSGGTWTGAPVFDSGDITLAPTVSITSQSAASFPANSGTVLVIGAGGRFNKQIASSRRYKKAIADLDPAIAERVLDIRTVKFAYRKDYFDDDDADHYGAIAEEVHDLGLHDLVIYNADDAPEDLRYDKIGMLLLPTVRAQREQIAGLRADAQATATLVGKLRDRLDALGA
jgi:hypothetical protein